MIDRHSNHRSANRLTPCSLLALPGEEKAAAARERREEETDEEAAEPMQAEANETVAFEADETGEAEASSMGYEAVMPHEEVRVVVFIYAAHASTAPHPCCAAHLNASRMLSGDRVGACGRERAAQEEEGLLAARCCRLEHH